MKHTLTTNSEANFNSQIDQELVNAIRDGKLIQIPFSQLTEDEKRAAHVAMFHQYRW